MTETADDLELRRRRLAYRAHHRGTKEMDLILGRFADETVAGMDAAALACFEALIEVPDRDLYSWIAGREPVPGAYDNEIMAALKAMSFAAADYGEDA